MSKSSVFAKQPVRAAWTSPPLGVASAKRPAWAAWAKRVLPVLALVVLLPEGVSLLHLSTDPSLLLRLCRVPRVEVVSDLAAAVSRRGYWK